MLTGGKRDRWYRREFKGGVGVGGREKGPLISAGVRRRRLFAGGEWTVGIGGSSQKALVSAGEERGSG